MQFGTCHSCVLVVVVARYSRSTIYGVMSDVLRLCPVTYLIETSVLVKERTGFTLGVRERLDGGIGDGPRLIAPPAEKLHD